MLAHQNHSKYIQPMIDEGNLKESDIQKILQTIINTKLHGYMTVMLVPLGKESHD